MEIIQETKETLKKLSKVNLDFIDFVEKNPESLKRSSFSALNTGSYSYKLQSWPTFISREIRESFCEIGVKICDLIKSIPARVFSNEPKRIASYFQVSEPVIKLQLEGVTENHLSNLVGRADFTYSATGVKCLEFNISVNSSGWQLPEWESLYLNVPIIERFLKEYRVKITNENYLRLFLDHVIRFVFPLIEPGRTGDIPELNLNIVLAIKGNSESLETENPLLEELRQVFKERLSHYTLKGNIDMCDYEYLEYIDNMVYLNGKRIHILIELLHGILSQGVMNAYTLGKIYILNGPVSGLLMNKLTLAVLSENEESSIFSLEEQETIKKYIPWTRKIIPGETSYRGEKIRMEEFLLSNKDKLVIKSSMGLGGQQVHIGQGMFRKQWENLVNNALRKGSLLVQELVEPPRGLYQAGEQGCAYHDTVWGVWILGSQYGASFVRVLPGGNSRKIVNGAQGAEISVVFDVDE